MKSNHASLVHCRRNRLHSQLGSRQRVIALGRDCISAEHLSHEYGLPTFPVPAFPVKKTFLPALTRSRTSCCTGRHMSAICSTCPVADYVTATTGVQIRFANALHMEQALTACLTEPCPSNLSQPMVTNAIYTFGRHLALVTLPRIQETARLQYLLRSKRWAAGFISCLHTRRCTFAMQTSVKCGPLFAYGV